MQGLNEPENPEVTRALRSLADRMRDQQAPARVEAAVLAKFRKHHARPGKALYWWAGASAAAGLIAAMWAVPRWSGHLETLPALKLAHASTPPISMSPVVRTSGKPVLKPVRRARRAVPPAEVASDFFPLAPGMLADFEESASLVRVSLPRSAMRRFGFPLGNDSLESVQADIVLGHDGTARAVRFVSVRP